MDWVKDDSGKLSKVIVTEPSSGATVEVYLFGATVTSWKPDGKNEKLFLSKKAILDGSKAIRGGIPVVFPQFATSLYSQLPQHGFARSSCWRWSSLKNDGPGSITVSFVLDESDMSSDMKAKWNQPFLLTYSVTLKMNSLTTTLTATNTGNNPLEFTSLLHTYFRVEDIRNVTVQGLRGHSIVDKVDQGKRSLDQRESINFNQEVDRIYEKVGDKPLSVIENGKVAFKLQPRNFTDTVIWNPWIETGGKLSDMEVDGYIRMLCVEVGSVSEKVVLSPGQEWQAGQDIFV